MTTSLYSIMSYWGPRPEEPEALATRYLRALDALSKIDPVFGNWYVGRTRGIRLASMSREDLVTFIADGISREDDGTPFPQNGYRFGGTNGLRRTPRTVNIDIRAGNSLPADSFINTASIRTEPLDDANAAFINLRVFKAATLALVSAWSPTWCGAYPWDLLAVRTKPEPWRPRFDLAWITYISARFAPLITPPATAIVERPPEGGLLMIATEERFSTENPAHLAVARDIERALAPVNALPWPPDATPEKTGK